MDTWAALPCWDHTSLALPSPHRDRKRKETDRAIMTRPNQFLRDVREALLTCRIGLERSQELHRRQQDACYSPRHCNVIDPSSVGMGRLAVVRSVRIQTVGRPCCCLGNKPGEGGVPRIILEPLDDVAAPSPIKGRYLLCSSCICGPASQTLLRSSR